MERRGSIVWWTIPEHLKSNVDQLCDYDLDSHAPRNDRKSAIIKAVKQAKQKFGWDFDEIKNRMNAQHLKPIDDLEKTVWEIHKPITTASEHTRWELLAKVTLWKRERRVSVDGPSELREFIAERFKDGKETLDAEQIRSVITSTISGHGRNDCRGFIMRKTGGVYFVDDRFSAELENLKTYLENVGGTLTACPIYSDSDTEINLAANGSVIKDLRAMLKSLNEDTGTEMTDRMIENREDKVHELIARANVHSGVLDESKKELENLVKAIRTQSANKPFDITSEMSEIIENLK